MFACIFPDMPNRITVVILIIVSVLLMASEIVHAQTLFTGPDGIGRAVADDSRELPIQASILVVRDEWKKVTGQWEIQDRQFQRTENTLTMTGHFELDGKQIDLQQAVITDRSTGLSSVTFTLTARPTNADPINLTAIALGVDLLQSRYAGWSAAIDDAPGFALPKDFAATQLSASPTAQKVTLSSPDLSEALTLVLSRSADVRIQDGRGWNGDQWNIMCTFHTGELAPGTAVVFGYQATARIPRDAEPAQISIDAKTVVSSFDGTGGNFVYAIDDPATALNLKTLRLTWARAGAELTLWTPEEKSVSTANDSVGSALRRRFELDQKLMRLSEGRLILSIWRLPEWLYDEPIDPKAWRDQPGTVSRDKWPKLAQVIGTYLEHLKTNYAVEPMLLSFNENDMGIYVKLDAESNRDLIKFLGQDFARRGLKTKLLLGDSASLKDGLEQIQLTLADAEAMKFVGALAYHPWAGENDLWDDWAECAKRANVPLLTTELGADAGGYRDGSFNLPRATMALARRYVEQLRDAKSQGLLEWEWTGDYSTYDKSDGENSTGEEKAGKLVASRRHAVLWHFANLTPQFSSVFKTVSTRSDVPAVALSKPGEFAIHVLNIHEARRVRVDGIPSDVTTLFVTVTNQNESAAKRSAVEVMDGSISIDAPARSLITFTSLRPAAYSTGVD